MEHMITVEEADKIIFDHINAFLPVEVPLEEAYGLIVLEDIHADRNFPPFDRVTMDGIAINYTSWERGNRSFIVEGTQKAGIPAISLKDQNACLEAMTGAVLPKGCNCVVPVEHITIENGSARVHEGAPLSPMMHVHGEGSDYRQGVKLVEKGSLLWTAQIAVAAAVGKTKIKVCETPRIAVIGTGDELVGIDRKPEPFQIRQSNSYAVQSALTLRGYKHVTCYHLDDDKEEMRKRLEGILADYDIVILSGGISRGKFDFVPEILQDLGVNQLFYKVKQRPGKPFWFGVTAEKKPVFALPGNPVSTQVGTYRYVLPYLDKATGSKIRSQEFAILNKDVELNTELTTFLPVRLNNAQDGRILANPVPPNGSGDFVSLVHSEGYIELPANTQQYSKGFVAKLSRWKL